MRTSTGLIGLALLAACDSNANGDADDDANVDAMEEVLACPDPIVAPGCPDGREAMVFDAFSPVDAACGLGSAFAGPQGSIRVEGCTLTLVAQDFGSYESASARCVWQLPPAEAVIVHASVDVGDGRASIATEEAGVLAYDRNSGGVIDDVFRLPDDVEIPKDRPWLRFRSNGVTEIAASSNGTDWTTYGTVSSSSPLSQLTASVECDASQGLTCYRTELRMMGALFVCP